MGPSSHTKVVAIFAILCIFSPLQIQSQATNYRLPTDIKPSSYDLTLTLDDKVFESNTFQGELEIIIDVKNETDKIVLHANNLNISMVSLTDMNNTAITILADCCLESNNVTDFVEIGINGTKLQPDTQYKLKFEYIGQLRTDIMYGFHRSSYEENGVLKYLATTQFQPTHARKAFPCFDEPSFKAKFTVTIKHPIHLNAMSNTAGQSVNGPTTNMTTTTFETTPKMSSYLVAFIVSEFTCTEGEMLQGNLPSSVCSRQELNSTRTYAVEESPKILKALEDYTGIPYSHSVIGKMAQVAIPDFAAGAMENWGLVTYRETALLYDDQDSSNANKQRVATVIAHEFTHMWFGDLVTTHWWSDTFLNEGWAAFLEDYATGIVNPDWEMDKQFVIQTVQTILESDALESAQPLHLEVGSPADVSARFGSFTYDKGASVLRMLQHAMGKDAFQNGTRDYLNNSQHEYSNTKPEDLWNALQKYNPKPEPTLTQVMENWINRIGFPLISAKIDENYTVVLTQEKFVQSGNVSAEDQWYVPISYTTSESKNFNDTMPKDWLLPNNNLTLPNVLDAANESSWIIINIQRSGYFRVDYDQLLWERIVAALGREDFDGIGDLNRAQIVSDLFNLAKIGKQTYDRVINWIEFLSNDVSYYPWYSALQGISQIWRRLDNNAIRTRLSADVLRLMKTLLNDVPFDDNKDNEHINTLKKVLALTWACRLGDSDCLNKATSAFDAYKNSTTKPNKNLRSLVYCTALSQSKDILSDWNFLWGTYNTTQLAAEKATILGALGCSTNQEILKNYLAKSIDQSSGIRQQDALSVFQSVVAGSSVGVDVAFDFLIENYQTIPTAYGSMNSLQSMMNSLVAAFNKQDQITKLEDLENQTGVDEDFKKIIQNALKTATTNINWTKDLEQQLGTHYKINKGTLHSVSIYALGLFVIISSLQSYLFA